MHIQRIYICTYIVFTYGTWNMQYVYLRLVIDYALHLWLFKHGIYRFVSIVFTDVYAISFT